MGDSPDRIGLLAKKEVNDIKGFFLSISSSLNKARSFAATQNSTERGTTEFIHTFFREWAMGPYLDFEKALE